MSRLHLHVDAGLHLPLSTGPKGQTSIQYINIYIIWRYIYIDTGALISLKELALLAIIIIIIIIITTIIVI